MKLLSCVHALFRLAPWRREVAFITLAALTFPILLTPPAHAQTWQTVDDFQYISGQAAENYGLCIAPNGTLLAAGFANHPTNLGHALVMASTDGGNTWSAPLDDFLYQGTARASYVGGIVADGSGNLYAAGCAGIEFLTSRWLVRRSSDNGLTWSTVDDFSLGGLRNAAYSIAADATGDIYVVGVGSTGTTSYGPDTWIVRKGVNGTSWSTVDTFGPESGSAGLGVIVHPTAGVLVVGNSIFTSGKYSYNGWTVRRSLNGGATWSTVDTFQLGNTSVARGIGTDARGNLYVVGNAFETIKGKTASHWITRRSNNGGAGSWITVDDFQPPTGGPAVAHGFVADSLGNAYVAGLGAGEWLVRKSIGGIAAWSTVDTFQYAPAFDTVAQAITADATGHVFVGGYGTDATGVSHWLVRKY